ncbi:MAG: NADH-quinone oxidoreductase subunit E [Gammaproteobacteria bacterium]|nr:NADH-quinone oxidoreductase subunit E [Porticoccaceae bacterium]MBK79294.1 NADH-quinone oxidoreductase subunit E [Gammaproteobacteria bacterium]HAF68194.1 NADH-quinone oxidoreductase subunit E [Acidimicrobiaceae bacterium]
MSRKFKPSLSWPLHRRGELGDKQMSTLIESDDDLSANDLALSYQDTIGGPIRALRAIVAQFGYINDNHISNVADVFNLSRAEVRGIVSFYADLRTSPPAKHKVRICQGEACQSVGSRALTADFMVKSQVLNQSKAPDYVEHEPVVCLGLCPRGPVAMINDELVAHCSDANSILERLEQ